MFNGSDKIAVHLGGKVTSINKAFERPHCRDMFKKRLKELQKWKILNRLK